MGLSLRLTVREFLSAHGVTAYQLAAHTQGHISRNTVYRLARNQADRIDLHTLEKLALALEQLTGQHITLSDLMVIDRDATVAVRPQPVARKAPNDQSFFTLQGAARMVGDGATTAELLQAIRWHRTLQATEIRPGVYRLSEKDIAAYRRLRHRGKHQPKPPPLARRSAPAQP